MDIGLRGKSAFDFVGVVSVSILGIAGKDYLRGSWESCTGKQSLNLWVETLNGEGEVVQNLCLIRLMSVG